MALIVRIDVDRPYGKKNIFRHLLSRISSEFYLPRIESIGYLNDLKIILEVLNKNKTRAYIFFRKCTFPSTDIIKLMKEGNHVAGMHLENSRTFSTYQNELNDINNYLNEKIVFFSKHGSGKYKYGFYHYPNYEPEKYITWANQTDMKVFFGNKEDPSLKDYFVKNVHIFPSAFWLEPHWRNTEVFDIEWLNEESKSRDIVVLIHPDNITCNDNLFDQFIFLLNNIPVKILN